MRSAEVTFIQRESPAPGHRQVFRHTVVRIDTVEDDGRRMTFTTQDWYDLPNTPHAKAAALEAFKTRRRRHGF